MRTLLEWTLRLVAGNRWSVMDDESVGDLALLETDMVVELLLLDTGAELGRKVEFAVSHVVDTVAVSQHTEFAGAEAAAVVVVVAGLVVVVVAAAELVVVVVAAVVALEIALDFEVSPESEIGPSTEIRRLVALLWIVPAVVLMQL